MKTTSLLKQLISESYQMESDLVELIKECLKEIFKDNHLAACSLFEEDLEGGRDWNGCLQSLEFYKRQLEKKEKGNE